MSQLSAHTFSSVQLLQTSTYVHETVRRDAQSYKEPHLVCDSKICVHGVFCCMSNVVTTVVFTKLHNRTDSFGSATERWSLHSRGRDLTA